MNVFCVGLTTKDSIFYLPQFPQSEGKYLSKDFTTCGGGPAATAATTIARLGGKTSLWSRVGDDLMGEDIIEELRRYTVNTTHVEKVAGTLSTNATVLVNKNGERFIISYSDPNLYQRDTILTEKIEKSIRAHDAVLADTRWTSAARITFSAAKRAGIPSILDGEVSTDHSVRELVGLVSHAILSYKGLLDLLELPETQDLSRTELEEALNTLELRYHNHCYVTRGSLGAFYLDDHKIANVPAYQVNVVDTLGAGDVFHGAFAYYLLKRYPVEKILQHACAAASMKCTASGGRGCLPTTAMLQNFLQNARPIINHS